MIYDTYDSQRRLFYVSLEVCSHRHFYHTDTVFVVACPVVRLIGVLMVIFFEK